MSTSKAEKIYRRYSTPTQQRDELRTLAESAGYIAPVWPPRIKRLTAAIRQANLTLMQAHTGDNYDY